MTYGGFYFDCGSLSQLGSFYLEKTATILWIGVLHVDGDGKHQFRCFFLIVLYCVAGLK